MTRREDEKLSKLIVEWGIFKDTHAEHKAYLEAQFKAINDKIEKGQHEDQLLFREFRREIYDDEKGLRVRVKSLEKTRGVIWSGLVAFGTLISTLFFIFWDKISEYFIHAQK